MSKVPKELGKLGCHRLNWKDRALFLSESFAMIDWHEYETKTFITYHPILFKSDGISVTGWKITGFQVPGTIEKEDVGVPVEIEVNRCG